MKKIFVLFIISNAIFAQTKPVVNALKQPKLVVGIVIDQMRQDYIYRYWNKFGNGGFKKIINEGFFYKNAHYNYVPTYTGPGHASIYTGTSPATHGIIGNDWFVKETGKMTYCTYDEKAKPVGTESAAGSMSPKNLLVTTIGDELKLNTNQQSKVFSVSFKDRSSILPAGHSANGAFWFDGSNGNFVSSSHYMNQLPAWMNDFNNRNLAKQYLSQGWNTLYPLSSYVESIADQNNYESAPNKKENPVFPYEYKKQLDQNDYSILKATPYGNTIVKDLALACLKSEQLGKGKVADMLCVSFSSTDYVGHYYGPRSVEVEDVYLRLDKDLEELINTLNSTVGKDNYVLFLTADHGACDVPAHLRDLKIPGGYVNEDALERTIKSFCRNLYGDSLVLTLENQQLFLNENKIYELKLSKQIVEQTLANYLLSIKGVAEAYSSEVLRNENFTDDSFKYLIQKGYNHVRSGNVVYSYNPAWMEYQETGTTHGASYSYDTHVPVLFYGMGIPKGSTVRKVHVVDIAPTISMILHTSFPNGTTGKPLEEVIAK
ncbi:MAG: alkaline phosphatase [Bacteroidetes bacterium]|jgi:predicted AlkP superfamily pyrophosphatase or phosphodiesterase|nr:alkaline phosphatase [Bacteroidota bacterium]